MTWRALAVALALLVPAAPARADASVCYGTPAKGRLAHGVRLPRAGANFSSYSTLGWALGRTAVHDRVHAATVGAWRALETASPGTHFVVGETGLPRGGPLPPHRTHQNGLSVDFMVPVRRAGRSVPLPAGAANRYGYDLEFDDAGRMGEYTIDFEALGEHLYRLHEAARAQGIGISRVIFEVPLQRRLWKTRRGPWLRTHLSFSTRRAWVRHDEHYHVDFAVECEPLAAR